MTGRLPRMHGMHFLGLLFIGLLLFSLTGCGKKNDTLRIGVLLPLTGPAAQYGESGKRACEIALIELKRGGGAPSREVELIYGDDQADPKTGLSETKRLINLYHVPAIICASNSSVALSSAPYAQSQGVVFLASLASNPELTDLGDFVFRNCVSDLKEGAQLARLAYDRLGYRNAAILRIQNDYGQGVAQEFARKFFALGGSVTVEETFDFNGTDFRSQLTKIQQSSPDALFIVGYKEMVSAFIQMKEMGLDLPVVSTVMLNDPQLIRDTRGAADGAVFSTWQFDPTTNHVAKRFSDDYKKQFGVEPDVFAAQTYDAVLTIAKAAELSGASIRDGLYEIKGFIGATGTTDFDQNGDAIKNLDFKIISNGEISPLGHQIGE